MYITHLSKTQSRPLERSILLLTLVISIVSSLNYAVFLFLCFVGR